jgi:riboflavin biosynthesis pyrimidine reductase
MNRPRITLHIFSTLDGKNDYTSTKVGISDEPWVKDYVKIHKELNAKATFVGRATAEEEYAHFLLAQVNEVAVSVNREDFIAYNEPNLKYLIAFDSAGALSWSRHNISLWESIHVNHKEESSPAHIIEVLAENVPDYFLAHLRKVGVSYIFSGKTQIDLPFALAKLKDIFCIDDAIIAGGAILNGSFHAHGFIDELSLYLVPVIEGSSGEKTIVEVSPRFGVPIPKEYKLENIQPHGNGVHLKYKKME